MYSVGLYASDHKGQVRPAPASQLRALFKSSVWSIYLHVEDESTECHALCREWRLRVSDWGAVWASVTRELFSHRDTVATETQCNRDIVQQRHSARRLLWCRSKFTGQRDELSNSRSHVRLSEACLDKLEPGGVDIYGWVEKSTLVVERVQYKFCLISRFSRKYLSPRLLDCETRDGKGCSIHHLVSINLFARNFYLCSESVHRDTVNVWRAIAPSTVVTQLQSLFTQTWLRQPTMVLTWPVKKFFQNLRRKTIFYAFFSMNSFQFQNLTRLHFCKLDLDQTMTISVSKV